MRKGDKKSRTSMTKDKKSEVAGKDAAARPQAPVPSGPPAMQITIGGEPWRKEGRKREKKRLTPVWAQGPSTASRTAAW
jgi:hypothetical protein